jgi:hypothetical protein
MGDKIRKLGAWFWRNKERLILAVMVIFLCTRVYEVFKEQEIDTTFISPPGLLNDFKIQELEAANQLPPFPPPPPPTPFPYGQYGALVEQNAFFYHATSQGGSTSQEQQWDLSIERIAEPTPGAVRVRVRHGNVSAWYNEGESFAEYELQAVDVASKTVTIYSTRYRETREFQAP